MPAEESHFSSFLCFSHFHPEMVAPQDSNDTSYQPHHLPAYNNNAPITGSHQYLVSQYPLLHLQSVPQHLGNIQFQFLEACSSIRYKLFILIFLSEFDA